MEYLCKKNTGDTPAEIGSIQITFVDADDSIVGTFDMVIAVPNIHHPGETTYNGKTTIAQAAENSESIIDTMVNINFNKTTEETSLLDTENVSIKEVNKGFGGP